MIKISRNTADFIRNDLKKPQFVKSTIGKGKKKTYYCVTDPKLMYELKKNNITSI